MNTSLEYLDVIGPEPSLSDYKDSNRWGKWMVWYRRFCKLFPGSNCTIDESGKVHYHRIMRSQRTRMNREAVSRG